MVQEKEIEGEEREKAAKELLGIMKAVPRQIYDPLFFLTQRVSVFNPEQYEEWQKRMGHAIPDGMSVKDHIKKQFGDRAAELAEMLLDI